MKLEDLIPKYNKLQEKYGAKELDSIYNGGAHFQVHLFHFHLYLV